MWAGAAWRAAGGVRRLRADVGIGCHPGTPAPVTMTQDGVPLTISDPSSLLFVTYVEGCITTVPGDETALDARAKRVGLAAYDPRTNTIVARSTVRSVETPGGALPFPLQSLFHPQFLNGYLYTYAVACDQMIPAYGACGAGRVLTARVPLDSLAVGSAYEYSTSTGWTSDPIQAETVLPDIGNGFGPLAVHVGDFSSVGEGYLLMEQVSAGGHYRLWQSYSPAGPWTLTRTDVVPGCGSGPGLGCYHVWGHPDLSTEINLLYSFFDQNEMDSFVRVASIGTVP